MLEEREQHRLNSNVCLQQHSDSNRNRVVKLPEVSEKKTQKNEYSQIAQQTIVAK